METQTLTPNRALGIMANGLEVANKRGAFTLQESSDIHNLVQVFKVKPQSSDGTTGESSSQPSQSDHNKSLEQLVRFLEMANKRGSYSTEESHVLWSAAKVFLPQPSSSAQPTTPTTPTTSPTSTSSVETTEVVQPSSVQSTEVVHPPTPVDISDNVTI